MKVAEKKKDLPNSVFLSIKVNQRRLNYIKILIKKLFFFFSCCFLCKSLSDIIKEVLISCFIKFNLTRFSSTCRDTNSVPLNFQRLIQKQKVHIDCKKGAQIVILANKITTKRWLNIIINLNQNGMEVRNNSLVYFAL